MELTIKDMGTPKDIKTKYGVKQKNWIKASEKGDNFLSYWVSNATKDWMIGKTVTVDDVVPREYEGKTYYDIVMPKLPQHNQAPDNASLERILSNQVKHGLALQQILEIVTRDEKRKVAGTDIDYPEWEGEPII